MSKYSSQMNGKVLDWHFKHHQTFDNHQNGDKCYAYSFWIGEYIVGTIFPGTRREWSAVSYHQVPKGAGLIHGFASRHGAAEFLLQINAEKLREITK